MTPGFYEIPPAEYHADPCPEPSLSSSLAALIVTRSPAHARLKHPKLTPQPVSEGKETAAMGFGSVVHELMLHRGGGFAVWEGDTWRGGDAQSFKALVSAEGKTPIKRADFARAEAVVDSARPQLKAMNLEYIFEEGQSESVAIWKDRGHYMRAMFDRWLPNRDEIWDIKTTGKSAHPDQIARIMTQMDYDLRSEFYLMGAEKLTGKPSSHALGFCFLFIETEPPFLVTPCFIDQSLKARGRRRANEAVETWARCMDTGIWPGYVNGPVEIAAPGWVEYEIEDSITESNGATVL